MEKIYKNKKELVTSLIDQNDIVLDVGFWGQAVKIDDPNWVHRMLKGCAKEVYGVDLDYDITKLGNPGHYKKQSAENFDFDMKFDVIFAGDIIEHLSNPGLFLDSCARNLKKGGRLIITTPNCFALYNIAEKFIKNEPEVNPDHTFYFNRMVLKKLLEKNRWQAVGFTYLDDAAEKYALSTKRRFLRFIYRIFSFFTLKFTETLIVIAEKHP